MDCQIAETGIGAFIVRLNKKNSLKIKEFFVYPGPGSNRHECYLIGF